jgi:hypothetical protein
LVSSPGIDVDESLDHCAKLESYIVNLKLERLCLLLEEVAMESLRRRFLVDHGDGCAEPGVDEQRQGNEQ